MKKLVVWLLMLPLLGFAQQKQKEESKIMQVYELSLKSNESDKFREGLKQWKDCYIQNNGEMAWNVWNRIDGEGDVVVVTMFMDKWAEMDKGPDKAGEACSSIFQSNVQPHVAKMARHLSKSMPAYSKNVAERPNLIRVHFFQVQNSTAFNEVVKDVTSTIQEVKGESLGYWYSVMGGGPHAPDYMVSRPYKNFAEMDTDTEGPWDIYEKKHGKEKTHAMLDKMRGSVENDWSYLYRLDQELSSDPKS